MNYSWIVLGIIGTYYSILILQKLFQMIKPYFGPEIVILLLPISLASAVIISEYPQLVRQPSNRAKQIGKIIKKEWSQADGVNQDRYNYTPIHPIDGNTIDSIRWRGGCVYFVSIKKAENRISYRDYLYLVDIINEVNECILEKELNK